MQEIEEAIQLLTSNLKLMTDVFYDRIDAQKARVTIVNQNQWAIDAIRESAKQI
ncbi:MAG: hypothetical protein PHW53_05230 [Patescibacteria group bacterium]|nr:hypothetical protein [Patescibacteria group bacterium]